jgi:hypothetical protein
MSRGVVIPASAGTSGSAARAPRSEDLESEGAGADSLGSVIRHQAAEIQLFHGREMKAVQGPTVKIAGDAVLAEGGLKDRSGQAPEAERLHAAEHFDLRQIGSISAFAEFTTPPAGMELHGRLQFSKRAHHHFVLAAHGLPNGRTLRFFE